VHGEECIFVVIADSRPGNTNTHFSALEAQNVLQRMRLSGVAQKKTLNRIMGGSLIDYILQKMLKETETKLVFSRDKSSNLYLPLNIEGISRI
jgi:hypothetical protein